MRCTRPAASARDDGAPPGGATAEEVDGGPAEPGDAVLREPSDHGGENGEERRVGEGGRTARVREWEAEGRVALALVASGRDGRGGENGEERRGTCELEKIVVARAGAAAGRMARVTLDGDVEEVEDDGSRPNARPWAGEPAQPGSGAEGPASFKWADSPREGVEGASLVAEGRGRPPEVRMVGISRRQKAYSLFVVYFMIAFVPEVRLDPVGSRRETDG